MSSIAACAGRARNSDSGSVKMTYCAENKDVMATYEELIHKQYNQPVDGIFEDTREVLKRLEVRY